MTAKEQLLQEIEQTSEPILEEVLHFLHFLKAKTAQVTVENAKDSEDVQEVLRITETVGTVAWNGVQSESMERPPFGFMKRTGQIVGDVMAPAIAEHEWEVIK